ncbi:MAG TPA: hypothetical protein VJN18_34045 [Polyangiaceae bacterium]|nr:hypothetical protein [Polyangiaceae bacterium]
MSDRDPSQPKLQGTLLGVPAPRVENNADSPARKPVFVRSGTSPVETDTDEPPPLPPMALPGRPPVPEPEPERLVPLVAPSAVSKKTGWSWLVALLRLPVVMLGVQLSLWMLLAPLLLVLLAVVALVVSLPGSGAKPASSVASASAVPPSASAAPSTKLLVEKRPSLLAELEGRSPESLSASELIKLADGRAEKQREKARALREKVEESHTAIYDKAIQAQLLQFVTDAETARDALAALAVAEAPYGPDMLYEVWTGTSARTDVTELARALVYSKDVKPRASPALAVALELRVAEKCEDFKALLPKALKDGDRRVLHLLAKLTAKRGCGPKKADDCYLCLREPEDELTATMNAVKVRKAPAFPAR